MKIHERENREGIGDSNRILTGTELLSMVGMFDIATGRTYKGWEGAEP